MSYTYVPFKKVPYICGLYGNITFPENYHSEIEILYCTKGVIPYGTESGRRDIKVGQILFVGSGEVHERMKPSIPSQGVFIKFGSLLLGHSFNELANLRFKHPLVDINSKLIPDDIREGFKQLEIYAENDDKKSSGSPSDWHIRSILYRLALFLLNEFPHEIAEKNNLASDNVNKKMMHSIQNAMSYVEDNYMNDISLDDISKSLGYEKTYFCKLFKEATEQTFHQFLNQYRIQIACNYLSTPDIPIGDIASACGFSQFKTFCRVFKNEMGITPSQYRKQ